MHCSYVTSTLYLDGFKYHLVIVVFGKEALKIFSTKALKVKHLLTFTAKVLNIYTGSDGEADK